MAHRIFALGCLLLLPLVVGCSSRGGRVTFEPEQGGRTLTQSFSQAYITPTKAGEYDIVLVDNASDWDYPSPKKNQPLEPAPLAPMRQVMRIHLYWRPLAGTTKNPAATNASIDWYVLGPDGSNDMLLYQGAAYVTAEAAGKSRTVRIRDGRISLKSARGDLSDPIGSAALSGMVQARPSQARVEDVIAELRPAKDQ